MSKLEYKDLHLSDERITKPPHKYGKSWSNFRDGKVKPGGDDIDKTIDDDLPHNSHQRNRTPWANEPHDNIYIIIRKKRATLPMKVDW